MTETKLKIEPEILIYTFYKGDEPYLFLYRGSNLILKLNCTKLMSSVDEAFKELSVFIFSISKRRFLIELGRDSSTKAMFLLDLRLLETMELSTTAVCDGKLSTTAVCDGKLFKSIQPPFKKYNLGCQDMDRFLLDVDLDGIHLMSIGDHDITYTRLSYHDDMMIHTGRIYKDLGSKLANIETGEVFSFDGYLHKIIHNKYIILAGNPKLSQGHKYVIRDTTSNAEIEIRCNELNYSSDSHDQVAVFSIHDSNSVYIISEDEIVVKHVVDKVNQFLHASKHAALYCKGYEVMFALYQQPGNHLFTLKHEQSMDITGAISTWLIHEKECEERIAWLAENNVLPLPICKLLMQYM